MNQICFSTINPLRNPIITNGHQKLQNLTFPMGDRHPCNTSFFGLTPLTTQNGSSIASHSNATNSPLVAMGFPISCSKLFVVGISTCIYSAVPTLSCTPNSIQIQWAVFFPQFTRQEKCTWKMTSNNCLLTLYWTQQCSLIIKNHMWHVEYKYIC